MQSLLLGMETMAKNIIIKLWIGVIKLMPCQHYLL